MKERGKIFNTNDVQAILENRKTIAIKPVKNVRIDDYDKNDKTYGPFTEDGYGDYYNTSDFCPYGIIGDHIYVRETFCEAHPLSFQEKREAHHLLSSGIPGPPCVYYLVAYRADGELLPVEMYIGYPYRKLSKSGKVPAWLPPTYMPKKVARIWLEIIDVKVVMVQDITEEDAEKEGCSRNDWEYDDGECCDNAKEAFMNLWNSIHKNWNNNPWVYVIEFKRIEK